MNSSSLQKISTFLKARRFVLICALVMALATSLPYLFALLITPEDRVFTGLIANIPDTAQYLAWLKGFTRANLISNPLTPEDNAAVFFNLLWWLLAKISTGLHIPPVWVLQMYRIFTIFAFALALDWFIRLIQADRTRQRAAFLAAYFGGGLGWIWVVEKYISHRSDVLFPIDVYVMESNSFLALLGFNHFTISATLMLLVYGFFLLAYQRSQWRYTLFACLAAILLGWEHAYDILLMGAILAAFTLVILFRDGWRWQPVISIILVGATSIWPALYSVYITRSFPVWKAVLAQFDNADAWTPDPFHLLILLGIPFIIALLGYRGLLPLKKHSPEALFVRTWFLANLFLVYVPLNFQIHYLNGWQIPIAILAAETFFDSMLPWLRDQLQSRGWGRETSWPRLAAGISSLLFVGILLINVYLLAWQLLVIKRLPHNSFLYQDEAAALAWLAEEASEDDVILSSIELGQYIPSQTGARAFLAHWAMTKDLYEKEALVAAFFAEDTPDADRRQILADFGVDYVLFGNAERQPGNYAPGTSAFLEPCFSAPLAAVYCVGSMP